MPVEVLVIISPRPGKETRVGELVAYVVDTVKASEPEVSEYHSYRTKGDEAGTTDYVIYMRIKDDEALATRRELKHHQDIARFIKEEDLLRRPMRYMRLEAAGGWNR